MYIVYVLLNELYLNVSESNAARAIGQGGVPVLLNAFYDWHRVDSKNRHVTLRKSVLSVLKNITNLRKYNIYWYKFYSICIKYGEKLSHLHMLFHIISIFYFF